MRCNRVRFCVLDICSWKKVLFNMVKPLLSVLIVLNVNEEKLKFIVKSLSGAESGVGISERINRQ